MRLDVSNTGLTVQISQGMLADVDAKLAVYYAHSLRESEELQLIQKCGTNDLICDLNRYRLFLGLPV